MKQYWDSEIEKFDRIYGEEKGVFEQFVDLFRKDIILERAKIVFELAGRLEKGATVIDIGCGTGRQAITLAQMGFRVYGFDISKRAIELAKLRIKGNEMNVTFEQCNIVQKKYPECDMIVGLGLMDYLNTDEISLIVKQIKELNCKFVFSFPCKCPKSYLRYIYRKLSGTSIFLLSPKEIIGLFSQNGIDNVKVISDNLGASIVVHNFE
jgi:2-polyprenyl-3-methyl-5-hydroxy-6-metoxy-1,4-benzoquinol methylase